MTTTHADNLALFKSLTGKTKISPAKLNEDIVKMTGYQPSKVVAYRTWRR